MDKKRESINLKQRERRGKLPVGFGIKEFVDSDDYEEEKKPKRNKTRT